MKIVEFSKPFSWSENGWDVTEHHAGDITEVTDDCATTAIDAGKAVEVSADDLLAATLAHAKLVARADRLEQQAAAAWTAAVNATAKAAAARMAAIAARINRSTEAEAAALPDAELPPEFALVATPEGDAGPAAEAPAGEVQAPAQDAATEAAALSATQGIEPLTATDAVAHHIV